MPFPVAVVAAILETPSVTTVGASVMAKPAVTLILAVTLVSVRGLAVERSLHWTKWYPVLGTAVTAEPLAP